MCTLHQNSNQVEKPFVKHTVERILRKTEKDMKEMNDKNEEFGRRANGEVIPSSDEDTPPAEGMVENPFFKAGIVDEALEKEEKEKDEQWTSMLLRGAKAQLARQGRTRHRSREFQGMIDHVNFTRAFPELIDFEHDIYEKFYQSVETLQTALDREATAAAAVEWTPSNSNELELCEEKGCLVCEEEDDVQQEQMDEDESKPDEDDWANDIHVADLRHIEMFEYNQLANYGMTREEALEVAHEYQIKVEVEEEYAELPEASHEYYEPGIKEEMEESEELETEVKKEYDEEEAVFSLPSTSQQSQEQCSDIDTKLHDRVTYAVWTAIFEANHQNDMDNGDIPKAFDRAWSSLSAEQKDKLNQENGMNLGSPKFAKFVQLKGADAEAYEELRNEVLALEGSEMDSDSDDDIEFEVGSVCDYSDDFEEGSGSDDDDAVIEFDFEINNNSDKEESTDQKEDETSNAIDEESGGEEHEKEDADSSYSFEEVSVSDITEQEMPGDVEAERMRNELRRHMSSPPHVPRYMVDWSNEMERKYEKVAKMHLETLKQMLALKIKVENHINPKHFKRSREENEDAEYEDAE